MPRLRAMPRPRDADVPLGDTTDRRRRAELQRTLDLCPRLVILGGDLYWTRN